MTNFLGDNIRFLRKMKGLTQEKLAARLAVNRSLIGAYEEGRVEPKLQTIQMISHYFEVSIDNLLNTDLSKPAKRSEVNDVRGSSLRVLPIMVDRQQNDELSVIVPVKAAAGYLTGFGDLDYIESLPRFGLPFPELQKNKSYRIFQISGESMLPIPDGAYVICEYLANWEHLKNNNCYVLVTINEGVVYKRVVSNLAQGSLILKSDNPDYEPYAVPVDQVVEIWHALGYTTFKLPVETDFQGSINDLASIVMQLKKDMEALKTQNSKTK